jgi:hypothetical protein
VAVALLTLAALVLIWPASEEGLLTVVARAPLVVAAASVPVSPDLAQLPEPTVNAALVKTLPVSRTPPPLVQHPALAVREVAVRDAPVRGLPVDVLMPAPAVVAMAPAVPDLRVSNEPAPAVMAPEVDAPGIAMDQVQPMLTNVLHSLQSGRGEQVLQWLERSSRQSEAATRFVAVYNQRLAGSRVTGLGPVRFTSRHAGGQLVVDGMVQLWLQDERQQTTKQDFRLRAYFMPRDSGPVLARLEAD